MRVDVTFHQEMSRKSVIDIEKYVEKRHTDGIEIEEGGRYRIRTDGSVKGGRFPQYTERISAGEIWRK